MKLFKPLVVFLTVIYAALCVLFVSLILPKNNKTNPPPDILHVDTFLPGTAEIPRLFSENFDWEWDTVTLHRRLLDITQKENAAFLQLNLISGWDAENLSYLVFRKDDSIEKIVSYPLSYVFYDGSNNLIQAKTYLNTNSLTYSSETTNDGISIIHMNQ